MVYPFSIVVPISQFDKVKAENIRKGNMVMSIFHNNYVACNNSWFAMVFLSNYINLYSPGATRTFFQRVFRVTSDFSNTKNFLMAASGNDIPDDVVYLYLNTLRLVKNENDLLMFDIDGDTNIRQIADGPVNQMFNFLNI